MGDCGSLGHGVQWDSSYIGYSKKENAIMTSSNKCQAHPPSFCFLSRRNYYSCKSGEKKITFFDLSCNFVTFFCNFYYA